VLPQDFVKEVIEHMNTDHANNLHDFAIVFGGLASPGEVRMTHIDHQQMVLLCSGADAETELTIPLLKPVTKPEQLRGMLVAMAKRARQVIAEQRSE
jgi:putative heme iron utilization protein